MDVKYLKKFFVAKNCARTNEVGGDTIDTETVTGVQIYASKQDAGTAAGSYIGPGEMVVTDESGLVLAAGTADATINAIKIHQRSYDGKNLSATKSIEGRYITGYTVSPYAAPVECTGVISGIDASLLDYPYTVKLRKIKHNDQRENEEIIIVKSIVFRSAVAGSTAAQIVDGLEAAINAELDPDKDDELSVVATQDTAGTAFKIVAYPKRFAVEKFVYGQIMFEVETNFDCTIESNIGSTISFDSGTLAKMVRGNGTYEHVLELEAAAKGYDGKNRDKLRNAREANMVVYDTQEFEDDGTTENRYDLVQINWKADYGSLGRAHQQGEVVIALPVDDNATSQVDDIIDTLDAYIVTALAVPGTSLQVGNLT